MLFCFVSVCFYDFCLLASWISILPHLSTTPALLFGPGLNISPTTHARIWTEIESAFEDPCSALGLLRLSRIYEVEIMSTSTEFVRADSGNLPVMDMAMILEYFQTSDKHNIAEIRGVKTLMSSRDGYVESAVGYVELKRGGTSCVLKAKIVPEHKVTKKYYLVTIHMDEKDNTIIGTECDGCPASAGGCKHSLVFLFWLEKKASEPSPTSVTCYWKKPRLASEGTRPILSKDLTKSKKRQVPLGPRDPQNLRIFHEECKKKKIENSLILSFHADQGLLNFCIFDVVLKYVTNNNSDNYEDFKTSMFKSLSQNVIDDIENSTKQQAESRLWHSIRQGRITGSKVYEACHCTTTDGSLVEQILGGYKLYETKAMKRGKTLEKPVIREIEKKLNCNIKESGFKLINLICGASPDGIASNFIIEVKCPTSKKTVKNYVQNKIIKEKFIAQCQFQMLATGYKKCAFCVADPDFPKNKEIQFFWIEFDPIYAENLLKKSEMFWKSNIFPKILQSARS